MCYYTASRLRFCEIKLQAYDDDVMLSNVWFNVAFGAPAVKGLVCAPLPTYRARCAVLIVVVSCTALLQKDQPASQCPVLQCFYCCNYCCWTYLTDG